MGIKFVKDCPALLIEEEKVLVIADLHIGIEHEIFKSGIIIPSQAEKFYKIIKRILKLTKAKTLVILGDIKHKVPGISFREMKEIPKLFERLSKKVSLFIVKGNHDGKIEKLLPKNIKIFPSRGFKLKKYGFLHGHAWPFKKILECDYILMGHVHPRIEIKDSFGYKAIEQAWIVGRLKKRAIKEKYSTNKVGDLKLIIFPSFNKLVGGISLNKEFEENLAPLLSKKFFEIEKAKVYLLDGTFLGKIEDFMP